ncbi:pH-dependent sodium/proton antiporter [Actinobacillus pleuropneumoniae]|nr:pH-dependent sodium/proton antiporter [Actinobacillus pleuropneumoniae]
MLKQIQKFLKLEAASGILLLVSALLAMIFCPILIWNQLYFSFLQRK